METIWVDEAEAEDVDFEDVADEQVEQPPYDPDDPLATDGPVPVRFLTGQAGTGKTYTVRERIADDPGFGILCSTTGISAINLGAGVTTINSLLAYFDTESMRERYKEGKLTQRLTQRVIKEGYRNIVVDEASMMPAAQLQILYNALAKVNEQSEAQRRRRRIGLVLTGDFAQLAPVPDKDAASGKAQVTPWAFNADCWGEFDSRTYKLTEVRRQTDAAFLAAINAARRGDGGEAVEGFSALGVEIGEETADDFDGTTILATNEAVDRYNDIRVMDLPGKVICPPVERWGLQKAEWKKALPNLRAGRQDQQGFKVGAYVMILANAYAAPGQLEYANGDCGWIRGCVVSKKLGRPVFVVELKRGKTVEVPAITRTNAQKERPDASIVTIPSWVRSDKVAAPYKEDKRWVVGGVTYFPLRYAWASTTYKSQGLTLDACQIDLRPHFLGSPNQLYVALSRCKTAAGLRLVGSRELFVKRNNVAREVLRWL
jgi:hypothetical protein